MQHRLIIPHIVVLSTKYCLDQQNCVHMQHSEFVLLNDI